MTESIQNRIRLLKTEKNAIILAHYYQSPEVQEIADAVGDSYALSKLAKECSEDVIVFCGVRFMAESAKILSPDKTVILPVIDAGCPMAEMAGAAEVKAMKALHPKAGVVCYINSTAEVKAESDVCCTSSNAVDIVRKMEQEEILFLPDRNLGNFVQEKVPEKKIILWDGFCITHKKVKAEVIEKAKATHPGIQVLAHPECDRAVWELADFVGSTGEIIKYAAASASEKYLIVTEQGVLYELQKRNSNKKFYTPYGSMTCVDMKKTRLEDVYNCLQNMRYAITVEEEIRLKAYKALANMHILGR
ncbi:quinolinate synthase NadA [Caproiciproducens galactitolivorans]|uniref:Quinolinate synthase n=1 Tax=Caproiciproducens galactitolivorans TaxID=642589 RepID=A0A4Z0Y4R7_9FIRM|nr:quinolinate synthase NadA [Caproiciproducens galactitolivorans]QEY34365.1 quinolinate synthase NadA [Caproiciproducens galactitolivorans]TGJ77867.1 quinolinate synthase A [Caproiciproducens galactitolivorans]